MRNSSTSSLAILCVIFAFGIAGCSAKHDSKANLTSGYQALEARQYDAALSAADQQLRYSPSGPGAAEAHYLRGRALEQRPASSPDAARANLISARSAYMEALGKNPPMKLDAYIRTSLGNVFYFLDDYASAQREWNMALPQLSDPAIQSWVLYRLGLCQQRLGQFADADKTFGIVQQRYPNTVPAQRAREHQGSRAFSVQLATYANRATADAAINVLKSEGVTATATVDGQGRTVLRVGPFPSYQQAMSMKQRYASRYPDAMILP